MLAEVCAVEELPVEELDADDGEDELEEHVDHEDVEHVLQRDDDAVEDGLQLGDPVDRLEGAEDAQELQRFQSLACWGAPVTSARWLDRFRGQLLLQACKITIIQL